MKLCTYDSSYIKETLVWIYVFPKGNVQKQKKIYRMCKNFSSLALKVVNILMS